jgi:hypothetical protein
MSSEAIVVLVLIALATGFVIWIRMNSQGYDRGQAGSLRKEGEETRDKK